MRDYRSELASPGLQDDQDLLPVEETSAGSERPSVQQEKAVMEARRWFNLDKSAKDFYIQEMDENDKLYNGNHWDLLGPHGGPLRTQEQQKNRPNCVENVVFSLVEGLTAEFSNDVDLVYFPIEASDEDVAVTMSDVAQFIAYKNRIGSERISWLRNFFKHGTAIWEHVWDPYWRGGKGPNRWEGEVRWRNLHPRNFFPDARCGESLENARRVHKARYVTLEYLRERYPTYGHLAMEEAIDSDLISGVQDETGSIPEAHQEQVLLVETWYLGLPLVKGPAEPDQGPGLHVLWWCGEGKPTYLHHANYVYFEPGEEAAFPFTLRQRYPRDGFIWGRGEAIYLKQPQIAMNKTSELTLEAHMHHAVGMTLYQAGALTPEQRRHVQEYGTLPGTWHEVADLAGVKREFGSGVSGSLPNEVGRLQQAMENIVGRFDVSQGRTPGSVTAFRALDLLAQRAQVRLRSADVAITTAYEDCGKFIGHLITRNYTEERAYRIVGKDDKNRVTVQQRGVFNLSSVMRAYDYGSGSVMPMNQFMPMPGMIEGLDFEIFSPELDVQARTSTQMPSDRTFYMEMAKELYIQRLIDDETFFYVLEHGTFPPFEELIAKMQMQKQMMSGAPAGGPAGGPLATPAQAAPSPGAMPPNLATDLGGLPPELVKSMMKGQGGQTTRLANLGAGG